MKYATIALLSISLVNVANAETITGKVVGVSDGDTITVLDSNKHQVKVRLAQIDAPEKKQDYGQASKKALSAAVFNKDVSVEVETLDRYKRTVGKVIVNGFDANLGQVNAGMAWVYRQYAKDQAYYTAEDTAKAAKVGLWSKPNPTPPWEYRHSGKKSAHISKLTNIATWVRQRFLHF
jgi:endonuclease YncB( thermonuclease family)